MRAGQSTGGSAWVSMIYYPDHLAERQALHEDLRDLWPRIGDVTGTPNPLQAAFFHYFEGRWEEARPGLLALSRAGPMLWRSNAVEPLGRLAFAQGDRSLVASLVREWLPDGPATEPGATFLGMALALQRLAAGLALDSGDPPAARPWLECHDRWLAWSGAVPGLAEGQLAWASYHRRTGDLTRAHASAERALEHASAPRQPLALAAAHRCLGELATHAGRFDPAREHLAQSLSLAEACAAPYERALTLHALAELRLATGDRDSAQAAIGEARKLLEPLAARPALDRAAALASRLVADGASAPPVAPTSEYPAGLSAREVEVLRLVAQGLTNAQVAERLFLSPRTVDQHLRSIYNKLGVSSRAAATAFAIDHALR
jgi:DNA-binding CsgD family transcriptional regulator